MAEIGRVEPSIEPSVTGAEVKFLSQIPSVEVSPVALQVAVGASGDLGDSRPPIGPEKPNPGVKSEEDIYIP